MIKRIAGLGLPVIAASLLSLQSTSHAQPVSGLYISGGGGFNWESNNKFGPSPKGITGPAVAT